MHRSFMLMMLLELLVMPTCIKATLTWHQTVLVLTCLHEIRLHNVTTLRMSMVNWVDLWDAKWTENVTVLLFTPEVCQPVLCVQYLIIFTMVWCLLLLFLRLWWLFRVTVMVLFTWWIKVSINHCRMRGGYSNLTTCPKCLSVPWVKERGYCCWLLTGLIYEIRPSVLLLLLSGVSFEGRNRGLLSGVRCIH